MIQVILSTRMPFTEDNASLDTEAFKIFFPFVNIEKHNKILTNVPANKKSEP